MPSAPPRPACPFAAQTPAAWAASLLSAAASALTSPELTCACLHLQSRPLPFLGGELLAQGFSMPSLCQQPEPGPRPCSPGSHTNAWSTSRGRALIEAARRLIPSHTPSPPTPPPPGVAPCAGAPPPDSPHPSRGTLSRDSLTQLLPSRPQTKPSIYPGTWITETSGIHLSRVHLPPGPGPAGPRLHSETTLPAPSLVPLPDLQPAHHTVTQTCHHVNAFSF